MFAPAFYSAILSIPVSGNPCYFGSSSYSSDFRYSGNSGESVPDYILW
jgi:hypothetical protein